MCVYVYFRPPVHAGFLNDEVVVLQPRTGTAPDLGSIANYAFYSKPPTPPVSAVFMDILFPLYTNPPSSVSFVVIASISFTRSPPPLPEKNAVHKVRVYYFVC